MFGRILATISVLLFAFAILAVSILQSSEITYTFANINPGITNSIEGVPQVSYTLPFAGVVLPDSPLWFLKAIRDKIWFKVTSSPIRRAELALMFSDKRLAASKILFEKGNSNLGVSTLVKGEKYLEIALEQEKIARARGEDTSAFLLKIATSSLKHREIIDSLMRYVPDEAKAYIIKSENYAINAYTTSRDVLNSKNLICPFNPFDRE